MLAVLAVLLASAPACSQAGSVGQLLRRAFSGGARSSRAAAEGLEASVAAPRLQSAEARAGRAGAEELEDVLRRAVRPGDDLANGSRGLGGRIVLSPRTEGLSRLSGRPGDKAATGVIDKLLALRGRDATYSAELITEFAQLRRIASGSGPAVQQRLADIEADIALDKAKTALEGIRAAAPGGPWDEIARLAEQSRGQANGNLLSSEMRLLEEMETAALQSMRLETALKQARIGSLQAVGMELPAWARPRADDLILLETLRAQGARPFDATTNAEPLLLALNRARGRSVPQDVLNRYQQDLSAKAFLDGQPGLARRLLPEGGTPDHAANLLSEVSDAIVQDSHLLASRPPAPTGPNLLDGTVSPRGPPLLVRDAAGHWSVPRLTDGPDAAVLRQEVERLQFELSQMDLHARQSTTDQTARALSAIAQRRYTLRRLFKHRSSWSLDPTSPSSAFYRTLRDSLREPTSTWK
jgi:hypothetical protein